MLTSKDIEIIKALLEPVYKANKKTNSKLNALINLYDLEYRHTRKRVSRIEEHLNLTELPFES